MKRTALIPRCAAIVLGLLALGNVLFLAAQAAGLRINMTASMPQGIYLIRQAGSVAPQRGSLVVICPSANVLAVAIPRQYLQPGPCPGNVEPLLKKVAAVPGDTVTVSDAGVVVNGQPLPNSLRIARDCQGRSLPRIASGRYTLAQGSLWLYAPMTRSYDSRYFGPQPSANVVGLAAPMLIVGHARGSCA
jgi:conjugative transfer signal peptidase TraF